MPTTPTHAGGGRALRGAVGRPQRPARLDRSPAGRSAAAEAPSRTAFTRAIGPDANRLTRLPSTTTSTADRSRAYLALALTPVFFSANLVIGRAVVGTVEPFTLAFLRWTIAAAILAALSWRGLVEHRATFLRHWGTMLFLGAMGMWLCGGVVYYALQHTTATNGTLIYSTASVMMVLLDWAWRGTRIAPAARVGIAVGLAGVTVIVVEGRLDRLLALTFNLGDLIVLAATVAWSVYTLILKRPVFQAIPTLPLFAAPAIAGVLVLAPFSAWEIATTGRFPVTGEAWSAIVILAVVSSVLAFGCFQYGVKVLGPAVAGAFVYLFPAAGVLMSVLVLGESLRAHHLAGFALILVGVVLATAPIEAWRDRARARRA